MKGKIFLLFLKLARAKAVINHLQPSFIITGERSLELISIYSCIYMYIFQVKMMRIHCHKRLSEDVLGIRIRFDKKNQGENEARAFVKVGLIDSVKELFFFFFGFAFTGSNSSEFQ